MKKQKKRRSKSPRQKKKPKHNLGFWLSVIAGLMLGLGTLLTGISDILNVFLKLANIE